MPTLNWIGKEQIINHHNEVEYNIIECIENIGEENSGNLLVKGDNLLALKSLLPYYAGEVKMIYIDPPYNTGNTSWVYNDATDAPIIKKWLNKVIDSDDLSRSDKWLCMMYPRLKLLQKFLKEDGIIFISIDDTEVSHLRIVCDEIFGKANFVTQMIWNSEGNTDNQFVIKINHEYVLVYVKDNKFINKAFGNIIDPNTREDSNLWKGIADNNINKNNKANPPSIVTLPAGFPSAEKTLFYKAIEVDEDFFEKTANEKIISDSVKEHYKLGKKNGLPVKLDDMIVEDYKLVNPCRIYGGLANKNKLKKFIENNMQPIEDGEDILRFYINKNCAIRYHKEKKSVRNILSVLRNFGTTEKMKTTLSSSDIHFNYPKPLDLISYLIQIGVGQDENAVILDSFAGSGTTAHSVFETNKLKDKKHKFLLIEMEDYAEQVTKKRITQSINDEGKEGFQYCELSEPLFDELGLLNEAITHQMLSKHLYFTEFGQALSGDVSENIYLGEVNNIALYVFSNSVFKKADLNKIAKEKHAECIIYADRTTISDDELKKYNITFKQLPFSVKDK